MWTLTGISLEAFPYESLVTTWSPHYDYYYMATIFRGGPDSYRRIVVRVVNTDRSIPHSSYTGSEPLVFYMELSVQ